MPSVSAYRLSRSLPDWLAATSFSPSSSRPTSAVNVDRLALAHDLDGHLLADRRVGDDARQVFHLADRACRRIRRSRRAASMPAFSAGPRRRHVGDQRAVRLAEVKAFGEIVGHRLDAHAEPAAPRLAELTS